MPIHDTGGLLSAPAIATLPTLAIAPVPSRPEGTGESTRFPITLELTRNGYAGPVPFWWSVAGTGGAPADAADFAGGVLPSGSGSFAPGETSQVVLVEVTGDSLLEPDEGFAVTATASVPLPPATATVVIGNDDVAAALATPSLADSGSPAQGTPDNFGVVFAGGTSQA